MSSSVKCYNMPIMLDIQYIRENSNRVSEAAAQKGYPVDVAELLQLDARRRELVTQIETVRSERNSLADKLKKGKPSPEDIELGKSYKTKLAALEAELEPVQTRFGDLLRAVPNMPLPEVPVGSTEDENVVSRVVGEKPVFDFTPKHHWEILEPRDMLDKERAAKIAGSRFAYLKGGLVRLQFAIVQFVMDTLGNEKVLQDIINQNNLSISAKPFMPIIPPAMLRTEPYVASARLDAAEVTYKLDGDDLWLNASAEHTLCTMYWNEILPEEQLPIRYIGYSTSFRREAGTYGKDTEGIFRLHQFDKLEMEIFSSAETGPEEHKFALALQEYLMQQLGLPYQVLQKCTADIGKPNASGFDIEVWFPGQQKYRETHTADYMTDYQARDLQTRYRKPDGSTQLVHTNDATAFALGRNMAALAENYQTADGHIIVPEVLRPYMGGQTQI